MISLIAAMAKNRVIGVNNTLPWHLLADLKHFKALTLNKPIVMGRQTYLSIGKPLPKRENIILTTNKKFHAPGCHIVHSIDDVLKLARNAPEVMIIGGATVYQQFLPHAYRMYLTYIDTHIEGDTLFPEWNENEWTVTERIEHTADEINHYNYEFVYLIRNDAE